MSALKTEQKKISRKEFEELVKWSGLFVQNNSTGYFYWENGVRIDLGRNMKFAAANLRELMKPIKCYDHKAKKV